MHTPIWTNALPTITTLLVLGLLSYLILSFCSVDKTPPLILVSGFALAHIAIITSIIFALQLNVILLAGPGLYLLNILIIFLRLFKQVIENYRQQSQPPQGKGSLFLKLHLLLQKSRNWHFLGFLFSLPLLALILMFLTLFGQEPDYVIKAWTNTSDWTLSTQISPPDIAYDEHYLCTVGTSRHRRLVKPLRMGVRHGHRVVVNRQLQIANTFEQVIQERLPKLHHLIRTLYDRYGYPISRHIKQAWQADIVYLLMKPLEWLFFVVLYSTDSKPENRIAMQYISSLPDTIS